MIPQSSKSAHSLFFSKQMKVTLQFIGEKEVCSMLKSQLLNMKLHEHSYRTTELYHTAK